MMTMVRPERCERSCSADHCVNKPIESMANCLQGNNALVLRPTACRQQPTYDRIKTSRGHAAYRRGSRGKTWKRQSLAPAGSQPGLADVAEAFRRTSRA